MSLIDFFEKYDEILKFKTAKFLMEFVMIVSFGAVVYFYNIPTDIMKKYLTFIIFPLMSVSIYVIFSDKHIIQLLKNIIKNSSEDNDKK